LNARDLFSELKRRNVYRAAVGYAAVAWLLIQVATQILPFFETPPWVVRSIIVVLLGGFPVALVWAWMFEVTADGIVRTQDAPREVGGRRGVGRKIDFVIIAVLALAVGLLVFDRFRAPRDARGAKSIAVLPFENMSSEKENAYFADGVQDEILTHLAKIADLKVISRTSVMQYRSGGRRNLREIGTELGVAHLLEGSVQRAGARVRVIAQLIDARSDEHLWAQTYDRELADVFAIQTEIAKAIADQLHAKLSPPEKAAIETPATTNLAAYDLYLRARDLFAHNTDLGAAAKDLPEAARLLNEAVTLDPAFLAAWSLLARIHGNIFAQGYDRTPERLSATNSAAQSALRLRPDSGEAHLALASYHYYGFRDYERARQELELARRALPNNAQIYEQLAYIDRRQGRWPEATRNLEQALQFDPRNFHMLQQLALIYEAQARYAEEDQIYQRALSIKPGDPTTRLYRTEVQILWRADIKPFQDFRRQLEAENPALAVEMEDMLYGLCERNEAVMERMLRNFETEGAVVNGVRYPKAYWEGFVARYLGDVPRSHAAFAHAREAIEKELAKGESAAALSLLGLIDAGLGRKNEAIRAGQRACELVPVSKDAVHGVALVAQLAEIFAWVGEKDLAIERITEVKRGPSYLAYGLLKLHPAWDPLRGDPRFEAIVASLAPKD
jgi:TolB-like protein/Tfp pilus assembly protein PilF